MLAAIDNVVELFAQDDPRMAQLTGSPIRLSDMWRVEWVDNKNYPMINVFHTEEAAKRFSDYKKLDPELSLVQTNCILIVPHRHWIPGNS